MVFVSNFSQLVLSILSTHPLFAIKYLSPHQSFVVLSNFCHFLALFNLLTFYVIYIPYKCTYCTHHKHNTLSCLIVRTLSAPIYLSYSSGVFDHRAILTMGGSDRGWGFPHRTNRYVSASKTFHLRCNCPCILSRSYMAFLTYV